MRSYNGYPASRSPTRIGVEPFEVAGHRFPAGVKRGPVAQVLAYVVLRWHLEVEPLGLPGPKDEWGYNYRPNRNNPNTLSCHASGTAVDVNATRHPNGKRRTLKPAQVKQLRRILADVDDVVRWGGDFSTPDEMHLEICQPPAEVARVARRLAKQPGPALTTAPQEDDMTAEELRQIVREEVDRAVEVLHADAVAILRGKDQPSSLDKIKAAVDRIALKLGA